MFLTKHLKENNETYFSHMRFAGKAGLHFALASICYSVHAILPFIPIPERFSFESLVSRCVALHNHTVLRVMEMEGEEP